MNRWIVVAAAAALMGPLVAQSRPNNSVNTFGWGPGAAGRSDVVVTVNLSQSLGPLPFYGGTFAQGGEAPDYKFYEEMLPLMKRIGVKYWRCDPFTDRNQVTFDENGKMKIDFANADRIVDAVEAMGGQVMFNFSTVPNALGVEDSPWKYPTDLEKWKEFVRQVTDYYVNKRKKKFPFFTIWNEPNNDKGPLDRFLPVYEATARAIKEVAPNAKVGGPEAAGLPTEWMHGLMKFCRERNLPMDVISWHIYNAPAKDYVESVQRVRNWFKEFPEFSHAALVIGEWNAHFGLDAVNDNEFAAVNAMEIMYHLLPEAPLYPAFFEPRDGWDWVGPNREWWGRWGMITWRLTPKAVYNAYLAWNRLQGNRVEAKSSHNLVNSVVTRDGDTVHALVWHFGNPIYLIPAPPRSTQERTVRLRLNGLRQGETYRAELRLVDATHANAFNEPKRVNLETVAQEIVATGTTTELAVRLRPYSVAQISLVRTAKPALAATVQNRTWRDFGGNPVSTRVTVRSQANQRVLVPNPGWTTDLAWPGEWYVNGQPAQFPLPLEPGKSVVLERRHELPFVPTDRHEYVRIFANEPFETALALQVRAPLELRLESRNLDIAPGAKQVEVPLATVNRSVHRWEYDLNWAMGKENTGRRTGVSNGRKTENSLIALDLPAEMAVGAYPIEMKWTVAGREFALPPARVNVPMTAPRMTAAPTIDANLTDWTATPIRARGEGGTVAFRLQWDNQNLYFAAEIEDAQHVQEFEGNQMWRGDSIQFGIDPNRDVLPGQGYQTDDKEYGLALTKAGPELFRFVINNETTLKSPIAIKHANGKTVYETAIPWSEIGVKPGVGVKFGFGVLANNYDTSARKIIEWGGGIAVAKSPWLWPTVELR